VCPEGNLGSTLRLSGPWLVVCLQKGMLIRNEIFTTTERIISPKVSLMIGMHAQRVKPRNMIIALEEVGSAVLDLIKGVSHWL